MLRHSATLAVLACVPVSAIAQSPATSSGQGSFSEVRDGYRARFDESYELQPAGLKQSLLFASLPAGTGDLLVRMAVQTELELNRARPHEVLFGNERNAISIGAVLARIIHEHAHQTSQAAAFGIRLEQSAPLVPALLAVGIDPLGFSCGPCTLVLNPLRFLPTSTSASGEASLTLALPPSLVMAGTKFMAQWVIATPSPCPSLQLSLSDALEITVQ